MADFYGTTACAAEAGVPTKLVLRGEDSGGCARAFTIPAPGGREIVKENGDTAIDLGTPTAGKLRLSCAMGMQTGGIDFS